MLFLYCATLSLSECIKISLTYIYNGRQSRKFSNNITGQRKKSLLINYVISNQKSSRRNNIHLITLELRHVINHCDVRRGMCATSLSAKHKTSFAKNSRDIKSNLDLRQLRFMHKVIMVEQSNRLQKLYIHINYSYKANLLIHDTGQTFKYKILGY